MLDKPLQGSMEKLSLAASSKVQDTARVMDKGWEQVQKKTFINWFNSHLKKANATPISDLTQDLCTGESLIQLLQIIGDVSLGKYTRNPRMRVQKMENVNKALAFTKERGVALTNIGGEDVVDGNEKLIMGLIWSIILRFSIASISEEGLTAKEGLLLWCQRRTAPYEKDFKIIDFSGSWQNGLAFCALIHRHRPDLLDYYSLDKKQKVANTQLAFDVAEKHLNIPKLFSPEDIIDCVRPDERSVMTYVAQYFHAFSSLSKFDVAGRRVGGLAQILQSSWDMQNDYEARCRALLSALDAKQKAWISSSFSGYADAKRQLLEFDNYKMTTKRSWIIEKRELDTLLGNIQTKLKTYNMRPYNPPAELTVEALDSDWQKMMSAEGKRKKSISAYIAEAKDKLRKIFAEAANAFEKSLNGVSLSLASLSGELEAQLATTQELHENAKGMAEELKELATLDAQCVEAAIDDNEFTIYSVEDLSFEHSLLLQNIAKKAAFIENQIVARGKSNITPEQLEQFSQTFKFFDKDGSNGLVRSEFQAALQAEGTAIEPEKFEALFLQLSEGGDEIRFEQFIEYARSLEEDKVDSENITFAFQTLAGEKDYVTESDLVKGGISPEVIAYLKSQLPPKEDGYDFIGYVGNLFV